MRRCLIRRGVRARPKVSLSHISLRHADGYMDVGIPVDPHPERPLEGKRRLPSLPTNYFRHNSRINRPHLETQDDQFKHGHSHWYYDTEFVDRVDKFQQTVFLSPNWRKDMEKNPIEVIRASVTDYLISLSDLADSAMARSKIDSAALNELLEGVRNLKEFRVVEFGCNDGINSIMPIKTIIDALRRVERQDPEKTVATSVVISHVDSAIKGGMYHDWAELLENIQGPNSYNVNQDSIYSSMIGCENIFRDRLFPKSSVDFAFSTVGLQTLSELPFDESKCKACMFIREMYPDVDDPRSSDSSEITQQTDDPRRMIDDEDYDGISPKQWRLIKEQSAEDLRNFLKNRAAELKPGARLSLSILGGNGGLRELGVKTSRIPAVFEKNLRLSGVSKKGCVPMHFRDTNEVRQVLIELCSSRMTLDSRTMSSSKKSSSVGSTLSSKATEALSGALSSITGGSEESKEPGSSLLVKKDDPKNKLFELDVMWEDCMIHPAYTAWKEQCESLEKFGEMPKGPQIGNAEGGLPIYQEIPRLEWADVVDMGVDAMRESLTPDMMRFCDQDQWNEICEATKAEVAAEPGSDSFAINVINVLLTRNKNTLV